MEEVEEEEEVEGAKGEEIDMNASEVIDDDTDEEPVMLDLSEIYGGQDEKNEGGINQQQSADETVKSSTTVKAHNNIRQEQEQGLTFDMNVNQQNDATTDSTNNNPKHSPHTSSPSQPKIHNQGKPYFGMAHNYAQHNTSAF